MDIKKDYDQATIYYTKAADQVNILAMIRLGFFCGDIKKDYSLAETYFRKAGELGNSQGMIWLAWLYENIKKDYGMKKRQTSGFCRLWTI